MESLARKRNGRISSAVAGQLTAAPYSFLQRKERRRICDAGYGFGFLSLDTYIRYKYIQMTCGIVIIRSNSTHLQPSRATYICRGSLPTTTQNR